jgi:hypothetical protein
MEMQGGWGKLDVRAEMAEPTAVKTKRKVEMNSARYERSDGAEKQFFKWTRRLLFDAMAQLLLRSSLFQSVYVARALMPHGLRSRVL